ncbi:MAG: toll/interleukin-1 receptor domain-containing protein [Chitinophagaceae bacterium]
MACYINNPAADLNYFVEFIKNFQHGGQVLFDNHATLPSAKSYHGSLRVENSDPFQILSRFHGEMDWKSTTELASTKRLFIYSENQLNSQELAKVYEAAKSLNFDLQFRSLNFRDIRSKQEKQLGFISHDSRDKENIAKPIAIGLQKFQCPVWYDEFSLKVGNNLRTTIEKGLKECKKCVLILSPSFFSNNGWTKTESDSIFTRQILKETNLILPVWYNVTKHDVYNYSPSLLNIKGLDWNSLGNDEVIRQLHRAIDV